MRKREMREALKQRHELFGPQKRRADDRFWAWRQRDDGRVADSASARILGRVKTMPLMTPITWFIFIGLVLGAYGMLLLDR
jgi:hypothetical protein